MPRVEMPMERARLIMWITEALEGLDGFERDFEAPTGGNCEAMVIVAPDGRAVYITDGDSRLPYDVLTYTDEALTEFGDPSEFLGLCFSYYAHDDEAGYATLDEHGAAREDNVKAFLTSWAQGDPYHDEESYKINHGSAI